MNHATLGQDPTRPAMHPAAPATDPGPGPRIDPGVTPPLGPPPPSGLRRLALLATLLAAASLLLAVVVRGRLAAVHRDLDEQRARCACCTEAP